MFSRTAFRQRGGDPLEADKAGAGSCAEYRTLSQSGFSAVIKENIGVIHMQNRKKKEPVAFEVIEAAIAGDVVAINQIVDYFQPYINNRCRRKFIDESGQVKYGIDEYMKRRMETKLITKILSFEIQL